MAETRRRRRRDPFDVIGQQLEAANNIQNRIKQLLPDRNDSLSVELQAIREAFKETAKALTELQTLLIQVLDAVNKTPKPVTAPYVQDLLPEDDKREEWYQMMLSEYGPANEQVIRSEIDKLWAEIQKGRPHPGSRAPVLLSGLIEKRVSNRPVPRLAVLEEQGDAVDG